MTTEKINLIFAVNLRQMDKLAISVLDEHSKKVNDFSMSWCFQNCDGNQVVSSTENHQTAYGPNDWYIFNTKDHLLREQAAAWKIGRYDLWETNCDYKIGTVSVVPSVIHPLSETEWTAVFANPRAAQELTANVKCNKCGDSFSLYTSINEKSEPLPKYVCNVEDAPDYFVCKCGELYWDLSLPKKNMTNLVGRISLEGKQIINNDLEFYPMYKSSLLTKIVSNFEKLLEKNGPEEEYQRFLSQNVVVLSIFHPIRIWKKPKILNKYVADFAVQTGAGELLLIEIEKPSTKLMTAEGADASTFSQAIYQVRTWLYEFDRHRHAILEHFGVREDKVTRIRGILIAGRDAYYDKNKLKEFKAFERDSRIAFFTYDDVLANFANVVASFDDV